LTKDDILVSDEWKIDLIGPTHFTLAAESNQSNQSNCGKEQANITIILVPPRKKKEIRQEKMMRDQQTTVVHQIRDLQKMRDDPKI
jgi:mannose/fructose-specific phosphotransferase system component IIA